MPGIILGRVHTDLRVDCVFDPTAGEEGIAGVTVELLNEAGDVLLRTITDANGSYRFEGMRPGSYTVRELQPAEYFDGGNNQAAPRSNEVPVSLGSGETLREINFCEIPPSTLSGTSFRTDQSSPWASRKNCPSASRRCETVSAPKTTLLCPAWSSNCVMASPHSHFIRCYVGRYLRRRSNPRHVGRKWVLRVHWIATWIVRGVSDPARRVY